ncbi:MAG TPA: Na+/galactose cotransporter [Terracidiphilus sp.]
MPTLAATDSLILLIYAFFVLAAGFSLKTAITGSGDFMQAGRAIPAWLSAMAMLGASLGSEEVLGMGAAGARYGLPSLGWFALGSIPAMLFAGLYLMPVLYGSNSDTAGSTAASQDKTTRVAPRSIPEYLGLRFDRKTRVLNALLFSAMALFSAGIALYAMGRVFVALHVFDRVARGLNLPPIGVLLLAMALPAALVLAYVLLGGLGAAMYNQALQFSIVVAGLLPVVFLGLKRIGGWSGLKTAALAHDLGQASPGSLPGGAHSMGAGAIVLVLGVGLVLGGGTWCTDFRLLQTAMAAKDVQSSRRSPIIAAAVRVFVPLVVVIPGLVAVALPTPHTTIVIHNDHGAIYHDITVVPPAAEAGTGLVPAKTGADGKPAMDADGKADLDYTMATPNVLLELLPTGLLGLGVAALLACLMAGIAASATSFSTVFTCDIFQTLAARNASDKRLLSVARWATLGGVLLIFGAACAAMRFDNMLEALMLVFAFVNAPLFAVLLLAAFWKRATGHAAFAGLIAGAVAALLHHGLALPRDARPGIDGGWIAPLIHPSSEIALCLETAIVAFLVSLLITATVSLLTKARPEDELKGLVYSMVPRPPRRANRWGRLETMAVAILIAAIAINLIFI